MGFCCGEGLNAGSAQKSEARGEKPSLFLDHSYDHKQFNYGYQEKAYLIGLLFRIRGESGNMFRNGLNDPI